MKKSLLLFSMIATLCITGCDSSRSVKSNEGDTSGEPADSTNINSDSSDNSESSNNSQPSSEPSAPKEELKNDNFTLLLPNDLSSMSKNCKKYVDDMRAQQQKLIKEKGAQADYYINDLYGNNGVDITKGVLPSSGNYQDNTGGYRDGKTQNDYLDPIGADYTKGEKSDESKGIEIEFKPADSLKNKEYTITYGMKSDLSDAKTITTNDTKTSIKNLLVNQKYYYKVTADGKDSALADFTTGDYPRWIDARPMFNVRDAGGYMTSSGQRIKQGLVYRGGEITKDTNWYGSQRYTDDTGKTDARDGHIVTQTDAAKKVFREQMGMVNGVEIDLRAQGECGKSGNYNACGFAENGDITYSRQSISSYYNGMKNNTSLIKNVFDKIAEADQHPVYYHCYGGADRTGTIGFLLGAVLGMSYTDLVIDFELTSYSSNPSRNYRSHLRNGPWNDWPGLVDYLTRTSNSGLGWGTTKTIKQGAEEYLLNKCKVSQETINKIREIMLEPAK